MKRIEQPIMSCMYSSEQLKEQRQLLLFIEQQYGDIDFLSDNLQIAIRALEAIANVEHGVSGRNAGRNTFRAIAKEALDRIDYDK